MNMSICGLRLRLTEAIIRYAERTVNAALAHAEEQVDVVNVRMGDINGPRGGVDKYCRITVFLHDLPSVTVEAAHEDLYAAIDSAVARAKTVVGRCIGRRRRLQRFTAHH